MTLRFLVHVVEGGMLPLTEVEETVGGAGLGGRSGVWYSFEVLIISMAYVEWQYLD